MKRLLWFVLLAIGPLGCVTGEMHPGEACGRCHGDEAPAFGVAGTLYARAEGGGGLEGATIDLIDADGRTVSLLSNGVGNFFTTTRMRPPFQVSVWNDDARAVMAAAPSGDCNRCHSGNPADGPGRIHLP